MSDNRNNSEIIKAIREPRTMAEWRYTYVYKVRAEFLMVAVMGFIVVLLFMVFVLGR